MGVITIIITTIKGLPEKVIKKWSVSGVRRVHGYNNAHIQHRK